MAPSPASRRLLRLLVLMTLVAGAIVALWRWQAPRRTVFLGGPILTMDDRNPNPEALAVDGERIGAVGSKAEMLRWAERNSAEVVDLDGHALLPGFIDAHSHFPAAGLSAIAADLGSPPMGDVSSIDELVARVAKQAEETDDGEWVWGLGYDDTLLAEGGHPTREDLDRASTRHPIGIVHVSAHLAVANTRALELLGINADTPDPEGGRIQCDPSTGEPTGVLEETASEALIRKLAKPSTLDSLRILRRAAELYVAAGVTTAQNGFATTEQVSGLASASRFGLVPLRLILWPGEEVAKDVLDGKLELPSTDPLWVRFGAVKIIADGSIQGYTAYLTEPYHVRPRGAPEDFRGYPRFSREELTERVKRYHEAGWQLAIHGNGDAEIDDILDALEVAQRDSPRDDARPVIIHAQTARDDQLDRMRALGAIPSFFVLHTYYWGDRHRDIFLGPERAARISPTRSAEHRELPFTLHADTPVAPMEPLRIVWSAVNRRTTSGAVLGEDERVGVMEALRGVTIDAARQHFEEDIKGSLVPGKLADLVILDRSPLEDPETIDRIRVLETFVGGKSVYRANDETR